MKNNSLYILLILCNFLSPAVCRPVCPEWCECVSMEEGLHYLNCEWPHIPDAQVFLSFPIGTVTRLTIKCNKDSATNPRSKFSPFMFEKFAQLIHLSIENCHSESKTLPKSFANGLKDLKSLTLNGLSLKNVESSSLADLERLEKLTISSNLTNLLNSELCHLKDLKYLNLSNNCFTSFKDIGYANCDDNNDDESFNQVLIMDLENNRISKIETNSLRRFRGLRILRLSNNSLREIPSQLFDETFQLKELYLNNNQISVVDDLPLNLTVLDLSSNDLHIIPPTLSHHGNLHKLNLSQNFVDSNSPFMLDEMQQLLELDLSYNNLQNVQGKFFAGLKYLTDLRLNNNDIRHLETRCFQNLTRLKRLILSNNKISTVKRQHFDGISNDLLEINLHNNTVSSLDGDVFAPILNLNVLVLSKNWLLDIPAALYVLGNLRDLDLSQNKITKIRKFVLDNLTNLRRLNLSNNKITSIEKYLFSKMKNLKRLDLSYNSIEILQANYFQGADSLEEIFLQQNFLKNIAKVFSSLQSLRTLNVSENRIEKFELHFLPQSIASLFASHNQISRVIYTTDMHQREIETNLRIVDFSFNFLTVLDAEMLPNNLEFANFSHNSINLINDETFYNKTDLTTLDLRNNFLTNLNLSSLTTKDTNSKLSLYLAGNNLVCTCKLQWIISNGIPSMTSGHLNVVDYESLSCSTSMKPNTFRPLSMVQSHEFLCNYKVLCIDTCLCCEFDVCDCKNVCPDDCQCYNDAQNSLNVVKCPNKTDLNGDHFKSLPMYATVLYLDGGNVSQLHRNTFFGRYRLRQLFMNSSSIQVIKSKAFSGLTSLELIDLSDNLLEAFTGDEFYNTPKIEALFLNDNRLRVLELDAFVNLPNLKILTLHNNQLQLLPDAIIGHSGILTAMTLAGNPWKCDCDNRYNLQIWLPRYKMSVTDSQLVYCYENLTHFDNSTTVLSLLPPTFGSDVVKVNFWTFTNEINRTFCYPSANVDDNNLLGTDKTLTDEKLIDSQDSQYSALLLVAVAASGLVLLITFSLIIWKCKKIIQQKSFYNKYSAAPSVNSSNTAPTSGSVCNSPVPLLQYKVFVIYSKSDESFVVDELLPILEQSFLYSQICVLHRDFASFHSSSDKNLTDEIIKTMERSLRVVTVVSSSFIKNDWSHLHIRPAYQYFLRYKHNKLIMLVLENLPKKMDSMLGHYIRSNRCLFYNDPLFWQKFTDSMPDDDVNGALQGNESSNYSEMYGTIVPSRFV